ncbi:hypothetical protein [Carnobacterium maltaromaticum]|uniref:hypothetical protein n=1 Tax=Carnobacterium maltaromaticum TaxID=2751 RepID=UPI00191BA23D|nr:hypothetical protein [Carnobacterium maltaromaticum]CAD5897158.1 conserved exported hypothetical protein [Carnobacterium maltaromaticum]
MRQHKHELGLLKDVLVFSSILVTLGSVTEVVGAEQNQIQASDNQTHFLVVHPVDPLNPGVEATPVPPTMEDTNPSNSQDTGEINALVVEDDLDLPDGSQKILIEDSSEKSSTNQEDDEKEHFLFSHAMSTPEVITFDPFNNFSGGNDDDSEEPSYLEEVFSNLSGVMLFGTAPNQ